MLVHAYAFAFSKPQKKVPAYISSYTVPWFYDVNRALKEAVSVYKPRIPPSDLKSDYMTLSGIYMIV